MNDEDGAMTFINPMALSALAFLAVPILILFFINRRKIVLHWAAFEWMKKAKVVKRKKVKMDEILKLLAKLLLILALVIFAARPAMKGGKGGRSLVVVDNSPSMAALFEESDRLDAAKSLAMEIIRSGGGECAVYSFDDSFAPVAKLQKAAGISESALRAIRISPSSTDAKGFFSALEREPVLKSVDRVCFVSDFQKTHFKDIPSVAESISRMKSKKIVFAQVDRRPDAMNLCIESFSPAKEGFFPGRDNFITATVRNFSSVPAESVQVTFSVDGEKRDMAVISLGPRETGTALLGAYFPDAKEYRCEISLPPDALASDNTLKFVFCPGPRLNVLSVVGKPADDGFPADVFMAGALKSICGESHLNYRTVDKLQASQEDLASYDVVATFGMAFSRRDAFSDAILEYSKEPRTLMLFSDLSVEGYWSALGVEMAQPVSQMLPLDAKRLGGTYFEFMGQGGLDPSTVNFFKHASFPGVSDPASGGRIFVAGSQDAAMVFRTIGRSNAIIAGFMPFRSFTDMFYNPNFVQFTMRMLSESLNRRVLYSFTGKEIERLPTGDAYFESSWKAVGDSSGEEKLEARRDERGPHVFMKQRCEGGFYEIFADDSRRYGFGYNAPRDDCDIEPIPRGGLKEAEEQGLAFHENGSPATASGGPEFSVVTLVLLLLAAAFDFYAHFVRRRG